MYKKLYILIGTHYSNIKRFIDFRSDSPAVPFTIHPPTAGCFQVSTQHCRNCRSATRRSLPCHPWRMSSKSAPPEGFLDTKKALVWGRWRGWWCTSYVRYIINISRYNFTHAHAQKETIHIHIYLYKPRYIWVNK